MHKHMPVKPWLPTEVGLVLCALTACVPPSGSSRNVDWVGVLATPTPVERIHETVQVDASDRSHPSPTSPSPMSAIAAGTPTFAPFAADQQDGSGAESGGLNPLTGLLPHDPVVLDRRPLAIKISNYPRDIRPQYGLNSADVVYEYYIEWANTRFIGIFYGNDAKQIGPVRSGRYFDEHITRMYQAYYVFNFADPREYSYFLGGDLQPFMVVPGYGTCPPFFQYKVSSVIADVRHYETYFDSTRFAECLSRKNGDNTRPLLRSGAFNVVPPAGEVAPVLRIYTHYSRCDYNYWDYDPATGRYLRFQETSPNPEPKHLNDCADSPETYAPLMDQLAKKQVATDNVVVIYVSHTFSSQNEQDDEIYHINLVDSGRAYVFRNGVGQPARWQRTDIDQPLLLSNLAGKPISLKPGTTFYQVIGQTSSDWSDGTSWHFDFQTP
jgi:hypothetical protein